MAKKTKTVSPLSRAESFSRTMTKWFDNERMGGMSVNKLCDTLHRHAIDNAYHTMELSNGDSEVMMAAFLVQFKDGSTAAALALRNIGIIMDIAAPKDFHRIVNLAADKMEQKIAMEMIEMSQATRH